MSKKDRVKIIAEIGVNHCGKLHLAKKLIDVAVDAGADAVKFQTFRAENLNTVNAPKSQYHIDTTGNDEDQSWYELLKSQEISLEMHKEFFDSHIYPTGRVWKERVESGSITFLP